MDRKTKGRLAEAAALKYFVSLGYEVYMPFCDNSKYDMLVVIAGRLNRVSVKFTSVRAKTQSREAWSVKLCQTSRRNNGICHVDKFNPNDWDILAVYVGPRDEVVLIPVDETFKATTEVYVYPALELTSVNQG